MKYRVAVCDDEMLDREYAVTLLKAWAKRNKAVFLIEEFNSAEAFLFSFAEDKSYDIILLDIEMGELDGVALAKKIRQQGCLAEIVFITGFPDFIAQGYEVSALHYLMKPVKEEKLFEVLDKAAARRDKKEKTIILKLESESAVVPLREIVSIEAQGHYTLIKTEKSEFRVRLSLSEIEGELDDSFVKCHRSFIVGIAHIKSIGREQVLTDNGETALMSRRLYDKTNQAFIKFYKGDF